jgi:hypothetical protein
MIEQIFFFLKVKVGILANAEFDTDFKFVEEVAKNSCGKSYQQKSDSFLLLLLCAKVFR